MKFKEVEEEINSIFRNSSHRSIVMWYDEKEEFKDDISGIELTDAKLHILDGSNYIYTKYLIEYEFSSICSICKIG